MRRILNQSACEYVVTASQGNIFATGGPVLEAVPCLWKDVLFEMRRFPILFRYSPAEEQDK
jgi:hypothetical protein